MPPTPDPTPDAPQDGEDRRPWEPPALTVLDVSRRTQTGTALFTDETTYPSSSTYAGTS